MVTVQPFGSIIEITCSLKEKQSSTQTPDVVPYTVEEVEQLLDHSKMKMKTVVANMPLFDRENARETLEVVLHQERENFRWHVITTVGIPGSGKTFLLRKGIMNEWYPDRSIMMTFYEDAQIIDDGKMDPLVAFARQLVQLNSFRRDVDFNRIVDFHGVITAFRQKLGLSDETPLIVCVDELIKLREHHIMKLRKQSVDESELKSRATDRCKALRTALMAYQDMCTNANLPEIRFVWTSHTELFDNEMTASVGSRRQIVHIPLTNLTHENALNLLRLDELKGAGDLVTEWSLNMCAGNPRAIVSLPRVINDAKRFGTAGLASRIASGIYRACMFQTLHISFVEDHLAAVLTKSLNSATEDALRIRGALHKLSNGVECLIPSLVWAWANENHTKMVGEWLIEYFGSDANMNPKTFEETTLYFEGLLNHAYRQLKKTPFLSEYFDGADHIQENIKELIVHPRKVLRAEEPSSLSSLGSEELYNKLQSGQAVYSKNVVGEGGDILIPLMLSEGKKKATLYLFCAQCKLAKRVDNLQEVETKAVEIPAVQELQAWANKQKKPLDVHGLYFTTHTPKLQTAKRKGVWFTKNSMEKWLSRLGLPRVNYHHARTSTSGSSALLRHRAMSWSTQQRPHLPTARCNAPNLFRRICRFL